MTNEEIAQVCHEANRAYCITQGDFSQVPWNEASLSDSIRASAVSGVNFARNNPGAGPEALHNQWMADKLKDGWVYGEVKDSEKKTHPCLVPYSELPEFQKRKDALFRAVALALI